MNQNRLLSGRLQFLRWDLLTRFIFSLPPSYHLSLPPPLCDRNVNYEGPAHSQFSYESNSVMFNAVCMGWAVQI